MPRRITLHGHPVPVGILYHGPGKVQSRNKPGMPSNVTLYSNHLGEQVPYDGVSPVTWRIASYVLVTRDDGKVLVIEPPCWVVRVLVWLKRPWPKMPIQSLIS